MKKKKKIMIVFFLLWLLWVGTYFLIHIQLNGESRLRLKLGESYQEFGATSSFLGKNLSIKTKNNISTAQIGIYEVTYKSRNWLGITRSKKRIVEVYDATKPVIELKGNILETVILDAEYIDPGYSAYDNIDGDLTDKVIVENNVNTKQEGIYEVIYRVKDSNQNETIVKRVVQVRGKIIRYQDKYEKIDNKKNGWWSGNKFDHTRPTGGADINKLKEYSAYFMGPDDKTIYLTFDEGSNDTYLDQIAELLKKNNVPATFFLCGNYMKENSEQVKKWVEAGFSIGNHTYHHRSTPDYANETGFSEFQKEIISMEELYQEIVGAPMDKIYRDPKGEWSYRGLQMVQDMGYRSFFWSADYLDFDQTYSKEHAYNEMMKRYHNGAIYLLHPKQKGTYEALEDFIKEMRKLGYQFGLVKDIFN